MKKIQWFFCVCLMITLALMTGIGCAEEHYQSYIKADRRWTVNFHALEEINPDTCAWLYQEGTGINYPVVQGTDNEYYLKHLLNRKWNENGTLYINTANDRDFSDMITFMYGHNRANGKRFSSLPNYQDQAYYEAHPTMELIVPYQQDDQLNFRLEVFALIRIDTTVDGEYIHNTALHGEKGFQEYVGYLKDHSLFQSDLVPEYGDRLMAMVTCTNQVQREKYLLFSRIVPEVFEADVPDCPVEKVNMDARTGWSRVVEVPGRGQMQYYAQNDPVWDQLVYEKAGAKLRRTFGNGGCSPTSLAIVLANLVDEEKLWYLNQYSGLYEKGGMTFCEESVNQYYCSDTHAKYALQQPEEFHRYLPVVIGSFFTGNNQWRSVERNDKGTGSALFQRTAEIFDIQYNVAPPKGTKDVVLDCLHRGGMAIVTCGSGNCFTGNGHYMAVVAADDENCYIMDPYMKDSYWQTDRRNWITVLEPGLVSVKLADWKWLPFAKFYLFEPADTQAETV